MEYESRLTEVDKLIKKIDMIYVAIKGKADDGGNFLTLIFLNLFRC